MVATGIIAEFNPFHAGHSYIIEEARRETKADTIVVVMSGNYVQRGEPAFMNKYTRAHMALQNGADLVIELPTITSLGSASYFAMGGIKTLDALKVNHLCFGSENGNIHNFNNICDLFFEAKDTLDGLIRHKVQSGVSYPAARQWAMEQYLETALSSSDPALKNLNDFMTKPNNILGLEYLFEIKNQHCEIIPHTIKRMGSSYHDTEIDASGDFVSASALRLTLKENSEVFYANIPESCVDTAREYFDQYEPMSIDDFTDIILYKLQEIKLQRIKNPDFSVNIADLKETLLNKLLHHVDQVHSATKLIESVKSKDLTYTRISRALMHLVLNITNEEYEQHKNEPCPYLRVLGFNDNGQQYLSSIKKTTECPIIVKPADYKKLLENDLYASNLYNMILRRKSKTPVINDYQYPIRKYI